MPNTELGAAIKEARKRRGLSRRELGDAVRLSATQIYRIESGQSGINLNTLKRIASALNVEIASLLDSDAAATINTGEEEHAEVDPVDPHVIGAWLLVGQRASEYSLSPEEVLAAIEMLHYAQQRTKGALNK